MKTTIMHLMSLFLVLAFTASCGKKEGGSSGSSYAGDPLLTNPSLDATTQQNYQAVRAWYDGTNDNNGTGALFLKETKSISSSGSGFTFTGGLCFGFINIGNCSQNTSVIPNGCILRMQNTVFSGTPIMGGTNNKTFMGCSTTGATAYVKANNADLNRAISGNGMKLFSVQRLSSTNYVLGYGPEGYMNPTTYFEINTTAHSALNPVGIQENSQITKVNFQAY